MKLDTTYTQDGITYEAVITQSWVVNLIRQFSPKSKVIVSELTKAAESTAMQARQKSPPGLVDKSIIDRWNSEQRACANAMHNLVAKYPYVAMTLYRQGEALYNFCMDCALCAYDQIMDNYRETKR